MLPALLFAILWVRCASVSYQGPSNFTRSTLAGIAEYRAALTLDWLAAEDTRQRELARAFETEPSAPIQMLASDCINYGKPASGKVAKLMLELLKNLEGDDAVLIPDLVQALVRSKLIIETSLLEAEPDLDSLMETPGIMMGEPHATFPRILAICWMAATYPATVNREGWCPLNKVAKYLALSRPEVIAKHVRSLDQVIGRARFIMEDFIQHVTPYMYDKRFGLPRLNTETTATPHVHPMEYSGYPPKRNINPKLYKDRRPWPNAMHAKTLSTLALPILTEDHVKDYELRLKSRSNTAIGLGYIFTLMPMFLIV